jgi:hypothetical protein
VKAKPRTLVAKWSLEPVSSLFPPLLKYQQDVIDAIALHVLYELLLDGLRVDGMKALRHYDFEQLDKMAEAYPDLAKKLADPNLRGKRWK